MSSIASYLVFLWSPILWLSIILILVFRSILKVWSLRKRMPPGPMPLPLLGNLLKMRGAKVGSHEVMFELSKKYGDPMTLFFFGTPSVVLTKYELAKTILQQPMFSNRPESAVIEVVTLRGSQDIALGQYGTLWQFHRKVASKCMRSIIDAEKLEYKVLEAVDFTVEDMLKHPKNVEPKLHMRHVVYNIISSFLFEKTYKMDDSEFLYLQNLTDSGNEDIVGALVYDFLPFAKYLPLQWIPKIKRAIGIIDEFERIRLRQVDEHRKTYVKGELRDFCDAILHEQELLKEKGLQWAKQLTDGHVSLILLDFFNAGTETTSNTLSWFCLFMVRYPEIQEECHKNITEAIGESPPRVRDRAKLPFIEACIMETMRLRPSTPMGLPHANASDANIGDYFVPRGTMILANIYAMQIDPDYWEKPLEFDPRLHFIDEEGQLKKPLSYAPFGFGRRICIGEQLAKNDMFLTVVRLLQKVRLEPIDGVNYSRSPDYMIEKDFNFDPLPFSVSVSPRT